MQPNFHGPQPQQPHGFHHHGSAANQPQGQQGAIQPHGGAAANAPLTSRQNELRTNIKYRQSTLTKCGHRINAALGKHNNDEPFKGPKAVMDGKITAGTDPTLFNNSVINSFRVPAGGAIACPSDHNSNAPAGVANFVHALADEYTDQRKECLQQFLPPNHSVTDAFTTGANISVFSLNGGKKEIPWEDVTTLDILRLLVEEVTNGGTSKRHAQEALDRISLQPNESWTSAMNRLILTWCAAHVDPEKPYLSEQALFWRVVSVADLKAIQERAVALCLPSEEEQGRLRSFLLTHNIPLGWTLGRMTVDHSALTSAAAVHRGQVSREIFESFCKVMAEEGVKYRQAAAAASHNPGMGSLSTASTRLPPGQTLLSAYEPYPAATRGNRNYPLLEAGQEGDGYSSDGDDYHMPLAAISGRDDGQPRRSSDDTGGGQVKRPFEGTAGDDRRRPRQRRDSQGHRMDDDYASDTAQGSGRRHGYNDGRTMDTGGEGRTNIPNSRRFDGRDGDRRRQQGYAPQQQRDGQTEGYGSRGQHSDNRRSQQQQRDDHFGGDGGDRRSQGDGRSQLRSGRDQRPRPTGVRFADTSPPPPAPAADAPPSTITKYIFGIKTCFYHARGEKCRCMANTGQCNFKHDTSPVAYGAYPRRNASYTDPNTLAALLALEQGMYATGWAPQDELCAMIGYGAEDVEEDDDA